MNPQSLYQLDPLTLARIAPTLPQAALRVAVLFDGHRRLWEVLRDSPLSGRMTVPVVERLLGIGAVVPAAAEKRPALAMKETRGPAAPAEERPTVSREDLGGPAVESAPAPGPQAITLDSSPLPAVPDLPRAKSSRLPMQNPSQPPSSAPAGASSADAPAPSVPSEPLTTGPAAPRRQETDGQELRPSRQVLPASAPRRSRRREEPWSEAMLMPRTQDASCSAEAPSPAFDAADEAFFDSYQPEEHVVDTFWDLEETPLARHRALQRQRRLEQASLRRVHSGGWLRSLFAAF